MELKNEENKMSNKKSTQLSEFNKVNRVEVIDDKGRSYVKYDVKSIHTSIQDDNKTLKIFINKQKAT